jgi:ATP phosphoribosyltransferase
MKQIVLALPKGRILDEVLPLIEKANIKPEKEFFDKNTRKLIFDSNISNLKIIKIRSFDVATFVAFGAAHIGVCGSDVLDEFNYDNIYSLFDLGIGKCRLSIAAPKEYADDKEFWNSTHLRIATKYTNITKKYFESKAIQAECIKLNGSIELAPKLGLCRRIVDLVSTGNTLKANGMVEGETIMDISSKIIANKQAFKAYKFELSEITEKLRP